MRLCPYRQAVKHLVCQNIGTLLRNTCSVFTSHLIEAKLNIKDGWELVSNERTSTHDNRLPRGLAVHEQLPLTSAHSLSIWAYVLVLQVVSFSVLISCNKIVWGASKWNYSPASSGNELPFPDNGDRDGLLRLWTVVPFWRGWSPGKILLHLVATKGSSHVS